MKTSSAKAKGRTFQNFCRTKIIQYFNIDENDIKSAIMGESGEDLKLSNEARKIFPFSVECKNVEKLNIWKAFKQAESNCPKNTTALLLIKRNHQKPLAILEMDLFLKLISP